MFYGFVSLVYLFVKAYFTRTKILVVKTNTIDFMDNRVGVTYFPQLGNFKILFFFKSVVINLNFKIRRNLN